MNKLYKFMSRYREIIMALIDTALVLASYLWAYYLRTDLGRLSYDLAWTSLIRLMPYVIIINLGSILAFRLNRSLWMYISIDEALRVAMAVFTGNFIWFLIVMIAHFTEYIRSIPIIAAMFQLLLMLGLRIIYRIVRRNDAINNRSHRALILGAGSAGATALREITYSNRYDAKIVGFLDNDPAKVKKVLNGVQVLGTDKDMERIVNEYNIDSAFIAIKNISRSNLKELIEKCRDLHLRTRIVSFELHADPNKPETSVRNVSMDDLLGRGELSLNNGQIGSYLGGKTIMVTGAGGSIGSELVRQIMEFRPKQLVLVDIYENTMYELQQEINIARRSGKDQKETVVTCLIGSVRDRKRIDQIFDMYHPQVVFHAAAHKHVPLVEDSPLEAIKNNVFGTKNVIESAIAHKAEKSTKAIKKEYHRIKETDLVVVALNSETVALNSRINSLLNRFTNRRMTNYDKFTESDKDDLRVLMNSAETLSKKIGVTVQ